MKSSTLIVCLTALNLLSASSYLFLSKQHNLKHTDIIFTLPPDNKILEYYEKNLPVYYIQYNGEGKLGYEIIYAGEGTYKSQIVPCLSKGMGEKLVVDSLVMIIAVNSKSCSPQL
ncbi:hypothetical protein ABPG72_004036 [Tetrahymena utriculariae]